MIFSSVVAFWLGSAVEGRLALEVFVFLVVLVDVLAIARVMSDYRAKVGWGFGLNKFFNQMIKLCGIWLLFR